MQNTFLSQQNGNRIDKMRDTNLELFRIITMLLIIAHHYVVLASGENRHCEPGENRQS